MAGALEGAVQYLIDHPIAEAVQYLTDHPIADAVNYIANGPGQIVNVTSSDVTNGNGSTLYNNPSFAYPNPSSGQNMDIAQVVIYNDPRAAQQTLNQLGLSNLI